MNRTKAILFYTVISLVSIIVILAFVRLPSIIFVGVEDIALSILFYIFSILGILAFCLSIIDFFIIKLGVYNLFRLQDLENYESVKQITEDYKKLKYEIYNLSREVQEIKDNS
jgi:hypothetical protein